jgi:TPP-dependent trihydroxycyclohexane-1,2-dione (THcHDO) dehydratase
MSKISDLVARLEALEAQNALLRTALKTTKGKKRCPLTEEQFLASAKPVTIAIGGVKYAAEPKAFKTGSFGWAVRIQQDIPTGEGSVSVSTTLNLVAQGSKDPIKAAAHLASRGELDAE